MIKPRNELKVLKIFLSITVILDAINGYITMYRPGLLEQMVPLVRISALALFILLIGRIDRNQFIKSLLIIVLTLSITIIRLLVTSNLTIGYLVIDLIYNCKILYFYLLSVLLFLLAKHRKINKKWLLDIIENNAYLMPLLIIIPTIFGLSRKTYAGSDIGSSGFFIANNSTNIVLIILSLFLVYMCLFATFRKTTNIIFLILTFATLWIQSSKTSLFFLFLEIIFILLYFVIIVFFKKRYTVKDLILMYLGFVIITAVIIVIILNYDILFKKLSTALSALITRQYTLSKLSSGPLDTLLSGRLSFFDILISYVQDDMPMIFKILGTGVASLPENVIVEMDIIDISLRAGILGFCLTYGLFFNLFFKGLRTRQNKIWHSYLIVSSLVIVGYSIFAGHVFGEIIASTFVSLCICGMMLESDSKYNAE